VVFGLSSPAEAEATIYPTVTITYLYPPPKLKNGRASARCLFRRLMIDLVPKLLNLGTPCSSRNSISR